MFTNPFGFVHSSDMIGRYTHTRKQANLFFPLFSFFFLFYTNRIGLPRTRQAAFFMRDRTAAACPVFPRPAAHPDTPAEGKDCTTPCGTPGFGQSASALSAFRSIQKPARPRSRNIRLPADRLPHDRHCKYPPFPRCIPAPPQDRDARFPSGPAFSAARARKKAASRAGTPPCQIRCSAVDYFLPAGSMTSTPSM